MNYIDIIIIAVLGLFLLIGVWKGFIKTVLSLISWGLSVLFIYLFAKKIADAIMSIDVIKTLLDSNIGKLLNITNGGDFVVATNADGIKYLVQNGQMLSDALNALFIPSFIHGSVDAYLVDGVTLQSGLTTAISMYIVMAVASILLILAVTIVMKIIGIGVKRVMIRGRLTAINRCIGGVVYLIVGLMAVSLLMVVLDALGTVPFMKSIVDTKNASPLGGIFTKYNPITLILNLLNKPA